MEGLETQAKNLTLVLYFVLCYFSAIDSCWIL